MNDFFPIIITEDHYNALGMIRSLGKSGMKPILILLSKEKTYVDKSKYVYKTFKVSKNKNEIIDCIKNITGNDFKVKYILFPLSDFAALLLDENYDKFNKNVYVPNMNGKMHLYQDKKYSKLKAAECGMDVAEDALIETGKPLPKWYIYPAIIKPLASVEGLKSDIRIVNDYPELEKQFAILEEKKYKRALLERYIHGSDECMLEVMGYSANGSAHILGIIKKIREYPIKNGSTSYAEIIEEHKSLNSEAIKKYIIAGGFTGLYDMEFKYSEGKAYFIECNFRNGAPGYALTCKGRNIPIDWINSICDTSFTNSLKPIKTDYFMVEQNDLINMLKGEIGFFKWLRELFGSNKLFFSPGDFKPTFIYYLRFAKQMMKRLF